MLPNRQTARTVSEARHASFVSMLCGLNISAASRQAAAIVRAV